jgi:mRNA-degrading endonuclease YafQ of YafQ-DinJ toxin-antitoxin module
MFTLVWTPRFTRAAKRFTKRRPEPNTRLARVLRDLELDPFFPHLRLHALRGGLAGSHRRPPDP